MKIKQAILKALIGLLILFATMQLVGGFTLSRSFSYFFTFTILYFVVEWLATKIRIFFLLPNMLLLQILFHSLLLVGLFFLADKVISGVTVTQLSPSVYRLFGKNEFLQSLGDFGTIGVVSLFMGTLYQIINWLNNER